MDRIPVFAGSQIIDRCDAVSIRRFIGVPNAKVIRKRKTNQIVQVNLASYGDDSKLPSVAGRRTPTYDEHLESHTLTVLKRCDDETGALVRWGGSDGFNPHRFNPDQLKSVQRAEVLQRRPSIEIAAKPSNAPHIPPSRFCIKRDPRLPWSAANGREVF